MIFGNINRLDKAFENIFENAQDLWQNTAVNYGIIPSVSADDDGIELKITLPGYDRENLEVSIEEDILTIETLKDTLDEFQREFTRSYTIQEDLDKSSCTTTMKAGILKIRFKYKKTEKSKKIIIK